MTKAAKELVEIVNQLPEEKAQEVIDFARFLTQQTSDIAWERIIADSRSRPKLDAFVADALREGESEPLEPGKL
ncbi:MAG TPA: DUF2281 domain-containing protein [Verrucomicrobiae bacterium]|jgi:hypothetical protein|nr:DUF2281 domain-containing protein [Verrucomicrobiae bacterium]